MSNEATKVITATAAITYKQHANIAVITMNNPPVNGLSHALRSGIVASVMRAEADAGIAAMVLIGNDSGFSAGADISEFGKRAMSAEPSLPAVIDVASARVFLAAVGGWPESARRDGRSS